MIIDELITDRTQADVDEVYSLKRKFKTVDESSGYILIQHLQEKDLVFDGTQAELNKYNAGLKGAINYSDLNRIGNAIRYIRDSAQAIGISISVVGKNDWASGQYVAPADAQQMFTDLQAIKTATGAQQSIPASFNGINYDGMNRIETMLLEAYTIVSAVISNYQMGGAVVSGVNDWLTA